MIHWDEIQLDYEPREKILPRLPVVPNEPEMSVTESAFLCGIIKQFNPKKIVEVGIAGGGTTAIILQCLNDLDDKDREMYSIDYSERFYRDENYVSGFLGKIALDLIASKHISHKFLYGKVACAWENDIGNDIDCLILDTTHSLPGELLDFITLLPQLKNGSVVILHDTAYNLLSNGWMGWVGYATPTLLAAADGEKYINHDEDRLVGYPNIAAFVVDDSTRENIDNLFLSLFITWKYIPKSDQLNDYRKSISRNYGNDKLDLFDQALMLQRVSNVTRDKKYRFPFGDVSRNERLVIYGAGKVGCEYVTQVNLSHYCEIVKWVDKRWDEMPLYKVDPIESIFSVEFDHLIIAIEDEIVAEEIKTYLTETGGVDSEKIIWRDPLK